MIMDLENINFAGKYQIINKANNVSTRKLKATRENLL